MPHPNKVGSWQYLIMLIMVFLFSACAREINASNGDINKQEAIDIAIEIASISMPEFSGSQIPPFNINAEKMTLEKAVKRLEANEDNAFSQDFPDTQIWLVTMDGIWYGATALDSRTPEMYQRLSIVLDAQTGLELFRNTQP